MRWDIWKPVWFKLGLMIDTTEIYILIHVCVTLTSQEWKKGNISVLVISQNDEWIWMKFTIMLRLVINIIFVFISSGR